MATLSAIGFNALIRAYYHHHLLSKGKLKKVAIVAYMRTLRIYLSDLFKRDGESK